jgi:hypothetical protein
MNEANQWIKWDFKTFQIESTHSSIQTHGGVSGEGHLQHWVLEGRIRVAKWRVLYEQHSDSQLNGSN